MAKKKNHNPSFEKTRPPVVTVLGHVDHGKTTLLDTIRKTNLANKEQGGITQRIGAYQTEITTKEEKKKITFIDTPGHEAFTAMRGRGTSVADIAVLVVSSVDGVMPQTKEGIAHIQAAHIPMIVAISKIDLPEGNINRIKQQLADNGVLVEGYGGDTVVVPLSAKSGKGISELLDMILLIAEMVGLPDTQNQALQAVIIESKLDKSRGPVATAILKAGSLRIGDQIEAESTRGKVRAMTNSNREMVKVAYPSDAVEILGFSVIPPIGASLTSPQDKANISKETTKQADLPTPTVDASIKIIIKADSLGTLDAIKTLLPEDVHVVRYGVGEINESDVLFAKTTGCLIVGFGVTTASQAKKLAEFERVMIKSYSIIYELADDIREVVEAIKEGRLEEILGQAEILAEFPFDRERIAGVRVKEGRLARGDSIRIERNDVEVGKAKIKSLRQQKNDVNKVETGSECGILLSPSLDFQKGDAIIAYR